MYRGREAEEEEDGRKGDEKEEGRNEGGREEEESGMKWRRTRRRRSLWV